MGQVEFPLINPVTGTVDAQYLPDLSGKYGPVLPSVGTLTYNSDGTVAVDDNGVAYTYNSDGTVHTATKGGVTRTATYNTDGTLGGWA